jgi:hypothetical protein
MTPDQIALEAKIKHIANLMVAVSVASTMDGIRAPAAERYRRECESQFREFLAETRRLKPESP